MDGKHAKCRWLPRLVCGLALAAWALTASAGESSPPRHAGRDLRHGPASGGPARGAPYLPYYPQIGIDVRPELEHWPSNYRPDGYRLPGYDGRPAGHHVCRGAHGTTLSSAGTRCPPGQKPETGGRHLSSDGS
ncbi:hypothetical protein [Salinisphaera sp. LB1]|uniref:hypothetical protein n=1 Tax=Salinisphaera sp. LB1 TaxID=2183911 RepID=UPI000D70688F|nr:hypothetical protein [Salinisphaera sp. LB1]AWN15994.1 hypothetical protein SALB1_1796 [Salinisphaera sp. LB1]